MSANQARFPIAAMARVLGVSKAGYDAWLQRPPSARATADAALLKRIKTVHAGSRQTYGAPRVHADLHGHGERHSRKRIARLMREAGLVGASHRHGGPTTTRRETRMTGPRPTWSTATSTLPDRTSCGSPTSLMCRQWRGFSISPSCSTPGAARSSAGRGKRNCARRTGAGCDGHGLLANVGPTTSSTIATRAANIPRWHSASGVARQVFDPQWGRSVTPTTTPWPRASSPLLQAELLGCCWFASQAEAKMACFSHIEGWYNPWRLHSGLGYRSPITYEADMQAAMTKT